MLGIRLFKYAAIIPRELKKIKTPVTMRNNPVTMETILMCFLSLLKCLRKVLMPRDVSRNGMARPAE